MKELTPCDSHHGIHPQRSTWKNIPSRTATSVYPSPEFSLSPDPCPTLCPIAQPSILSTGAWTASTFGSHFWLGLYVLFILLGKTRLEFFKGILLMCQGFFFFFYVVETQWRELTQTRMYNRDIEMNCRIQKQACGPVSAAAQNQVSTCRALSCPLCSPYLPCFFSVWTHSPLSRRCDCREPSHLLAAARKRERPQGRAQICLVPTCRWVNPGWPGGGITDSF